MKKALLLTAASSLLVISACSQQSQIESAINKYLEPLSLCLNIPSTPFPPHGMDNQTLMSLKQQNNIVTIEQITNGQLGVIDNFTRSNNLRLDVLVKAGLLTKTTKKIPAVNSSDKTPIANTVFVANLYNLTDAGQKTIQNKPPGSQVIATSATQSILCYAQPEVESIISTTEHTISGEKQIAVQYRFKYTNVADWINKPEIKATFPDIFLLLNSKDKTKTTYFAHTQDGWVPITPRFNQ